MISFFILLIPSLDAARIFSLTVFNPPHASPLTIATNKYKKLKFTLSRFFYYFFTLSIDGFHPPTQKKSHNSCLNHRISFIMVIVIIFFLCVLLLFFSAAAALHQTHRQKRRAREKIYLHKFQAKFFSFFSVR